MLNDDIYPNSGEYFTPGMTQPQAQSSDEKREETLLQLPLLKEVLSHIDKRIAFYQSVGSIPDEALTKPDEFMHIIAANKLTVQNLTTERGFILARIDSAKR